MFLCCCELSPTNDAQCQVAVQTAGRLMLPAPACWDVRFSVFTALADFRVIFFCSFPRASARGFQSGNSRRCWSSVLRP